MTEGEIKFKNDLHTLVIRALRAGATIESIQSVMELEFYELEKSIPFIKAMLEKDSAP